VEKREAGERDRDRLGDRQILGLQLSGCGKRRFCNLINNDGRLHGTSLGGCGAAAAPIVVFLLIEAQLGSADWRCCWQNGANREPDVLSSYRQLESN
jgi:hypothetical protein